MKGSFFTATLLLAAIAAAGWQGSRQLASSREHNARLLAEAASLGATPDPANPREKMVVHRTRENSSSLTAAEYIAFFKEMASKPRSPGVGADAESMRPFTEITDRMSKLSARDLERLIAELRTTPELDESTRTPALTLALLKFSEWHSQTALALFNESDQLLPQPFMRRGFLINALGAWAKTDPVAAARWLEQNGDKHPEVVNDDVKRALLMSAAVQDPKVAFELVRNMKFEVGENAISAILHVAKTPAERTVSLNALREYAASLPKEKARIQTLSNGLSSLADHVLGDGFQKATQWMDSVKLTSQEIQSLSTGIYFETLPAGETGQWLEWLGSKLPEDKAAQKITKLVDSWTQKDYIAAGTWLTATPEGLTKQAAVRGYARAVACYEPETAVQWAMTLPPGKNRDSLLQGIYHRWPKGDPAANAAAEAFADKHGIER